MPIGEADHFPDIQTHLVGNDRQFVGKGNVDIAKGVFDQLGHLGRTGIGGDTLAAHEPFVKCQSLACAARCDAADRAVIGNQFFKDLSGKDALWAISDSDVGRISRDAGNLEVRPQLCDQVFHPVGGTNGGGGFDDHRIAGFQHGRDAGGCGQNIADVGRMIIAKGCRHGDDEHISRFDHRGCAQ